MSSQRPEDEATISIPSIAIVAVIGYLIYRYFWSSTTSTSRTNNNGLRFTNAQVDTIAQMFPQLSRRDIMWDLQRNRGSVQATTERLLTGRGLDPAPPSFQPLLPTSPSSNTPTTGTTNSIFSSKPRPTEPDLITRYNLHSRINTSDKGKQKDVDQDSNTTGGSIDSSIGSASTATKDARQKILQRRRDEMILQARRKMLERDGVVGVGGGVSGL